MRKLALLAAATFAATAMPASASVVFGDQTINNGSVLENVLLPSSQTGLTVFGLTNQSATSVTFHSLNGDILTTPANGQARIETTEDPSSVQHLEIFLTGGQGFTNFEFNLNNSDGQNNGQDVTLFTNLGNHVYLNFDSNGSNWAGAAANGEFFTGISFNTNGGGYSALQQVRIGGIQQNTPAVPEPTTWAMMLVGFGAAGAAMRRGRRKTALLAQIA